MLLKPALALASHRQGSSTAVPANTDSGDVALERIAHAVAGNCDLTHSQFVAVVDRGRASQSQQQHGRDGRLPFADAAGNPRSIVIAKHPVWPSAFWQGGFVVSDQRLNAPRVPANAKQREVERQVDTAEVSTVIGNQALHWQVYLPDQQTA